MTVNTTITRRQFNKLLLSAAVATAVFGIPGFSTLAQEPLRIGIIGSGQIGGAIGKRWAEAGHQILFSSRNPRADRDGPMADEAIAKGTGVASAEFFPGTRLVRAFNAVSFAMVEEQHHRAGELIGIPVAGDDAEALAIAERLVRDAGFDPVYVGPLSSARRFDRGTDVYVRGMTAAELRQALNI